MNTNDLLKPRYKVMIKAPNCFKVGTIIEKHKYASGNWYVPNCMYDPDDYPEVFKKLEWWEERKPEDMPEYVRCIKSPDNIIPVGAVLKPLWNAHGGKTDNYGWIFPYTGCYVPATQTEYEQYINQKEKQ